MKKIRVRISNHMGVKVAKKREMKKRRFSYRDVLSRGDYIMDIGKDGMLSNAKRKHA
ncbi:hypothetical protein ACQKL5_20650 [Peribacillus sp. NPDC097675]|uniref:hypothetical protein n=1 Tax=Peribacillus sp. NPDC097675 TaxID=3390618 RepID=UPI003D055D8F